MLSLNEIQTQTNSLPPIFWENLNPEPCLNFVAHIIFTLKRFLQIPPKPTPKIYLLKHNHFLQVWVKL